MFGHGRKLHEARYSQAAFDAALHDELCAMASREVALIANLRASGALTARTAPIDNAEFARLSERHAERIWELIDDLELWPGARVAGDDGAHAAWTIVMHAQRDLDLQRRALDHIEIAVDFGDALPVQYATLADRIAMSEGHAQRYGTQFVPTPNGATLDPWPIDEPDTVDGRRALVGLPPLAEQLAAVRAEYHAH
jgi:hypothetical protein